MLNVLFYPQRRGNVNDADQFMCTDSHLYTPVTSTEVTVKYSVQ